MKGTRKYERIIWEKRAKAGKRKAATALSLPSFPPLFFRLRDFQFLQFHGPDYLGAWNKLLSSWPDVKRLISGASYIKSNVGCNYFL